jgi:hypothetical protein
MPRARSGAPQHPATEPSVEAPAVVQHAVLLHELALCWLPAHAAAIAALAETVHVLELRPEPRHPLSKSAVGGFIGGKRVGYLPRASRVGDRAALPGECWRAVVRVVDAATLDRSVVLLDRIGAAAAVTDPAPCGASADCEDGDE